MADVAMGEAGAAVRARPGGPRTIRPLYKAMQLAAVCACARRVIVPCARARVALRHVEARPRHPTHAQEPPKKVEMLVKAHKMLVSWWKEDTGTKHTREQFEQNPVMTEGNACLLGGLGRSPHFSDHFEHCISWEDTSGRLHRDIVTVRVSTCDHCCQQYRWQY